MVTVGAGEIRVIDGKLCGWKDLGTKLNGYWGQTYLGQAEVFSASLGCTASFPTASGSGPLILIPVGRTDGSITYDQ